jgi:hypothetical protein
MLKYMPNCTVEHVIKLSLLLLLVLLLLLPLLLLPPPAGGNPVPDLLV